MVELLSPAGEYNSFVAAVSAGADAVYLAGNMYGARASAVNFSEEEIIQAIKYAHLLNKKVYLTVNTLTHDSELEKLHDYLYPLYISGLDAVIVQDIGVFLYIKEHFKDLEIHVSTQAAVTSTYGADFYTKLGAKRIVLARELTLNEIKDITSKGIETECFIHGAMCYSYSGMCLFSSFLGGNSGNRGRCKGPCRQPYKFNKKEAYYLSLADMNTVDIIDKLIDSGIFSFKIEGRLKSPSYSAGVTSVYRKYIDMYLEHPEKELIIEEKDKELLRTLYSRNHTGHGYYERTSSKNMVTFDKGAYLKVDENLEKDINEKYLNNPTKKEIDFCFHAETGSKASLTVSCKVNDKEINKTVYSDAVIEKAEKKITGKDEIYKQLKKLGNTFFALKNCEIVIEDGFVPSSLVNTLRRDAVEELNSELECVLRKNRNTETFEEHNVTDFENISSMNSKINHAKKDMLHNENSNENIAFVSSFYQLETLKDDDFFDILCVNDQIVKDKRFNNFINDCGKKIYICLPAVLRKQNIKEFDFLLETADKSDRISGLYVNQYDSYEYLKSKNFEKEIRSYLSLYNFNGYADNFNSSLFDKVMSSPELSFNEIRNIHDAKLSVLMYGRTPLMYTANCVLKTSDKCLKSNGNDSKEFYELKDRLNVEFVLKPLCSDSLCMNVIYNSKPVSLHKYYDKLQKTGIKSFAFLFTNETKEEINSVKAFFRGVFEMKDINPPFEYTAYHFKNGVN